MSNKKILVIGSSNTDMVIKSLRIPQPGETILGGTFFMNAGGKGANQAVAAARLGGDVSFIAKTGDDIFGKQAIELFSREGIDVSGIIMDAQYPSGVALITVDANGENCIVVAPGANAALSIADIEAAKEKIESASIILMQLETPVATIERIAEIASSRNIKVVLNPAPVTTLSDELLKKIAVITPNQKEAEMLTGIKVTDKNTAAEAGKILQQKGIAAVIITMGAQGAFVFYNGERYLIESIKVNAVDTTAAGDVFNGALVVALANGEEIKEAVEFACKAAAISVTRLGAQASAPYLNEVLNVELNNTTIAL